MTINIGNTSTPATETNKRDIFDGLMRQPPGTITTSTALVRDTHANLPLEVSSATAITLTLPATATVGDRFFGINQGVGALSIVLNGGGAVTGNAVLPATIDQYSPFEVWFTNAGFRRVA